MNCPNCGTYNPEDRTVCWRCDKELPKPQPPKKKNPQATQVWLYVLVAVFLLFTILQSCGVKLPFGPQLPQQTPTGSLVPRSPVAWRMDMIQRI
jgi:predicted nucleic acid-binding Zn ribbon protein